jgi:cytochrome c-type biogenesis protein CcsB
VLAVAGLAVNGAAAVDLEPLQTLAIQDGGRLKPLDTFARETARRVAGAKPFSGGESINGLDPSEWLLSMLADPPRWRSTPFIRVTHAGLREAVALPAGKDRFSFDELIAHEPLLKAAERVHDELRRNPEAKLEPIDREIAALYDTLALVAGVFSGEALRLVPPSDEANATWLSVADLDRDESLGRLRTLLSALLVNYHEGDSAGMTSAAMALRARLAERAPTFYPKSRDLAMEVQYNRLKPFRLSWLLYLVGFLLLLASLPLEARPVGLAGLAVSVGAFALHTYGMTLRVLISGRPPVTNMYESVVFVAWGTVLFALIFEAVYRARYFAACASGLAVVALILADNVPVMDGAISPLVPVLRDNFWLTTHVLTITLGYAAFFLAMGLGHVNLGLYFLAPSRVALFKTLSLFLYRTLQVGTLFLALGTMLGGVWASYSWGRFWGWDPKETWALIALLGYLAVLHGRFIGWFKDFGMAVGSILGFLGVLMAWYGVNFILGTGLHSYGFGSGGYAYVGAFVTFEVLVVLAASLRLRSEHATSRATASAHA